MQKSPRGNGEVRFGDVQVLVGIAEHDPRRYLASAARGRLPPPPTPSRTARLPPAPSPCRQRRMGGRKQGPHLISDSAIANTAGMGEATGRAVKGDPLSAAFVLGKFALRDYGNPCAELRELEELVARNPCARCGKM